MGYGILFKYYLRRLDIACGDVISLWRAAFDLLFTGLGSASDSSVI